MLNERQLVHWICISLTVLTGIFTLFDLTTWYMREIMSTVMIFTVPGILLMLILTNRHIDTEFLVLSIGLSLIVLIIIGYTINELLPMIGIARPLSTIPVLFAILFVIPVLGIVAARKKKFGGISQDTRLFSQFVKINILNEVLIIIAMTFPILAILGANRLNSNNTNLLTIILYIAIIIYVFLVIGFKDKITSGTYPIVLFFVAISLLLSVSLRSNFISGWDISTEFHAFQLTDTAKLWSYAAMPNAYNICLSITILPTILHSLTGMDGGWIFKILLPIMLSITPVIVYVTLRKYASDAVAFLGAFFFMAQGVFYGQMPAIGRQEVAFLFFALSIMILLSHSYDGTVRKILFVIFGIGVVISHYSTGYVTLALFILTYISTRGVVFLRSYLRRKRSKTSPFRENMMRRNLTAIPLIILIVFSVIWFSQSAETSTALYSVSKQGIQHMDDLFSGSSLVSTVQFMLRGKSAQDYSTSELNEYVKVVEQRFPVTASASSAATQYKIQVNNNYKGYIPIKNTSVTLTITDLYLVAKYIFILSIVVFMVYLILTQIHPESKFDLEYIVMYVICTGMMLAILILPFFSEVYGFERLFQQVLIIVSLGAISSLCLVPIFSMHKKLFLMAALVTIFLAFQSGLVQQITGGTPTLQFYNGGEEYVAHYTHSSEIKGIEWLSTNIGNDTVYADKFGELKILAFGRANIRVIPYLFPSIIEKNGYVYATESNTELSIAGLDDKDYFTRGVAFYEFPSYFLSQDKNIIYGNSQSNIYH